MEPDPPKISCPAPVSQPSPNGQPIPAVYGTATASLGTPPVTIECTPASGSSFPVGTTTVTCTATDARQRTDTCSFTVTVTAPPRISLTRFLAFGDSMTAGEVVDPNSLRGLVVRDDLSYPTDLRIALTIRYTAQMPTVVNGGRAAETVVNDRAPSRLSSYLATRQYEVALILEGANDIANRDSRDIPPAINGLRTMVRDAKSRGVRPFLGTLPPENPNGCCPNRGLAWSLVEPFNAQLKAMASAEDVRVADVFQAFNNDFSLLGSDGLHPNAAGYQKIADTFFDVIKQNLELPPTSGPTGWMPFFTVPRRR